MFILNPRFNQVIECNAVSLTVLHLTRFGGYIFNLGYVLQPTEKLF